MYVGMYVRMYVCTYVCANEYRHLTVQTYDTKRNIPCALE